MTLPQNAADEARELAACPFCDGQAEVCHDEEFDAVFVTCTKCGTLGPHEPRIGESCEARAIEKWNMSGLNYRLARDKTATLRDVEAQRDEAFRAGGEAMRQRIAGSLRHHGWHIAEEIEAIPPSDLSFTRQEWDAMRAALPPAQTEGAE